MAQSSKLSAESNTHQYNPAHYQCNLLHRYIQMKFHFLCKSRALNIWLGNHLSLFEEGIVKDFNSYCRLAFKQGFL